VNSYKSFKVKSVQKKPKFYRGIRISRIARIQAIRFLIRAIRKIRIQKAFSFLMAARPYRGDMKRLRRTPQDCQRFSPPYRLVACLAAALVFVSSLYAQPPNRQTEIDSIQQVVQAAEDSLARLVAEINAWKDRGTGRLTGAQQVQWAVRMAALNRYYQTLVSDSDRREAERKRPPDESGGRSRGPRDDRAATIRRLQLLASLLETDRALYAVAGSLRAAVGNSLTIRDRLNEGNRSFGLQYGLFEEISAAYFDPARNRRTRSRYLQLQSGKDFLETAKAEEPELYDAATALLNDPSLQKIAGQSDASVLWANSTAALGAVLDPAADLAARTFFSFSKFFGNLVGSNLFYAADFLGIGESRGHALPAFHRYYPHPAGKKQGVHPQKVAAMASRLRSGDVLFDKTRFAITDKLIPGYFGHVAIYLESYDALRELGVFNTEIIKQATNTMPAEAIDAQIEAYAAEIATIQEKEEWVRLAIMRRRTFDKTYNGQPLNPLLFEALYRLKHEQENVIEALRDGQTISAHDGGVTLHSVAHFLYVDDFAAIRLRQGEMSAEKYRASLARFLALALLQYGKPYDFKFDVNTLDAIVCSELIYQSFVDVDFSTGQSLGSYTVSPDQVAQAAGFETVLDTLKLDPPFDLVQWYAEAMPLYPAPDSAATASATATATASDSLAIRAFMAMVREEHGGMKLLSPAERQRFGHLREQAKRARDLESANLRQTPVTNMAAIIPQADRAGERRLQNFYIALNKKIEQARAEGLSEAAIIELQEDETKAFAASAPAERATALADNFQRWQRGAAYRPSYVDLYSGGERFFLAVFRSARATDDGGFGRGLDLQLAGNNEAPHVSLIYTQYYSFVPLHLQFFNNSGKIHKAVQGGAALAGISRRYTQGDYVEMEAISWRNDAYATTLLPFTLEAGGDKGPLAAVLTLMTIGNGHYHRGVYIGEIGRVDLAPFEIRQHRRAFTVANLFYGARAQITFGKFRLYATGKLGARLGEFAERKKQNLSTDFPPIRTWTFGLELFGSTLYRPTSHRLEFEVIEDDARFIQGRLQKDRQMMISYRWSVNE
jgi:hypothetical protein